MNIIKKFMQLGEKQEISMIPSGEFNLLRSRKSPKSSLECIYNDAMLRIRKNGDWNFELVVNKIVEVGDNNNGDDSSDYTDDSVSVLSVASKRREEEWNFELKKDLNFSKEWNKNGDAAFVWGNTLGDEEVEKVQFVITPQLSLTEIENFLLTVYRCMYEAEHKKSASHVSREQLYKYRPEPPKELFVTESDSYDEENLGVSFSEVNPSQDNTSDNDDLFVDAPDNLDSKAKGKKIKTPKKDKTKASSSSSEEHKENSKGVEGEKLCLLNAKVFVYDPFEEKFMIQEENVPIALVQSGKYEFWLSMEGKDVEFGLAVSPQANPSFTLSNNSFTFNYTVSRITLSYKIEFNDFKDFTIFENCWSKCIWMALNKKDWEELPKNEQKYIEDSIIADLERDLDTILKLDDEEEESEDEEDNEYSKSVVSSEAFEDPNSGSNKSNSSKGNSSLTVAFRGNRSYVVRDDKIGVFKVDDDDDLEFVSAIKNISDKNKKILDPKDPMMYMEDRFMVLSDSKNGDKLYKMDIERGKIVDEWEFKDKTVVQYAPTKKFDQLVAEQTLLGISDKSVFKIDPRINTKNKIVQDESKDYASKYNFSSLATTKDGYVAVGSKRGDIRLYDRLGIRAKTLIPSLGQAIKYITVSGDGRWLLATCDASLLLMDLSIKSGKNAGNISFLKSTPASENNKTYILQISPEHATHILNYTKKPLCFTKAYFNTGINQKEDRILTSNGPFAISWSMKKVLAGDEKPYKLDWYDSTVIENNFEYNNKQNVIVALKNDVSLSKIKHFKNVNKSIFKNEPK